MSINKDGARAWRLTLATAIAPLAMIPGAAATVSAVSLNHGPMAHYSHFSHTTSYSTNWSGYDVTGGPFSSVSANWTQPGVTCSTSATYSSFWVGLDGDTSSTVEQTGTEADCSNGRGVYYGWYEMYPAYPVNYNDSVLPGDAMSASVTTNGSGAFTLTLHDATRGWTETVNSSLSSAKRASAEVIAEAPSSGSVLPLADFGTVNFSHASLQGPNEIVMVTRSGSIEALPSSYNAGAFGVTWEASGAKHHR